MKVLETTTIATNLKQPKQWEKLRPEPPKKTGGKATHRSEETQTKQRKTTDGTSKTWTNSVVYLQVRELGFE